MSAENPPSYPVPRSSGLHYGDALVDMQSQSPVTEVRIWNEQGKPDAFDIERNTVAHMAFGCGPHQCINGRLLEAQITEPCGERHGRDLLEQLPEDDLKLYSGEMLTCLRTRGDAGQVVTALAHWNEVI